MHCGLVDRAGVDIIVSEKENENMDMVSMIPSGH